MVTLGIDIFYLTIFRVSRSRSRWFDAISWRITSLSDLITIRTFITVNVLFAVTFYCQYHYLLFPVINISLLYILPTRFTSNVLWGPGWGLTE